MEGEKENGKSQEVNHSLEEVKRFSEEIKEEILQIKRTVDGQESCRVGGCNTGE